MTKMLQNWTVGIGGRKNWLQIELEASNKAENALKLDSGRRKITKLASNGTGK